MNVAIRLFAQKGYMASSTREIALMAGVNLSMINYYFSSKEKLLENIVASNTSDLIEKIKDVVELDISELEKIHSLIEIYAFYILGNDEVSRILFQEQLMSSYVKNIKALQNLDDANRKYFTKIIDSGKKKLIFASHVDPGFLYLSIIGTVQQYLIRTRSDHKVVSGSQTAYSEAEINEVVAYLKKLCDGILLAR